MDSRSKGWDQLGVIGTIYEEDEENSSSDTAQQCLKLIPHSPSFPSAEFTPSPQFSVSEARVKKLLKRNRDTNVVIHVHDSSFRLHKEVMIARSGYLKRQLKESTELTLSPPLNITAETFSSVTDFCYDNFVAMSPINIAALRTAAELLEMTEINDPRDQNLAQKTEAYFCKVIKVNSVYVSIVLRSSFSLLPEAETMSSLVSRCIEVLSLIGGDDVGLNWLDDIQNLDFEHLVLVLESSSKQLTQCHDILYMIIDVHLKENGENVSEEQKIRMCNYIECSILSPEFLKLAVQNPRMPIRFVVRAMHINQLNTRLSIITAVDHQHHYKVDKSSVTLGAILEHDATLRQAEQLKDAVTATNIRIQTLENELSYMRWIVNELGSGKECSTSLRFSNEIHKLDKGQIGSKSSLNVRDSKSKVWVGGSSSSSEESRERSVEKAFGGKLISGLKSAFGLQGLGLKKGESKGHGKIERKVGRKKDQIFS